MRFAELTNQDFVAQLASKASVPGGGGASALVGALGTALGNMVGSLTVGKKKYAAVEDDILALQAQATALQEELLELIDKDAELFEPLAQAYSLPKETDEQKAEKERVMAVVLNDACQPPLAMMRACCKAIDLHQEFAAKGSRLAISDVGVGVIFCKAALQGASLNVFINTKAMTDRSLAAQINAETEQMLAQYVPLADEIFASVESGLK